MRWRRGHTGSIEDRRSQGGAGGGLGGGMGGIPIPASVGGGGALLIVVAIIVLNLLSSGGGGSGSGGLGGVLDGLSGGAVGPVGTPDLTNDGDEVEFIGYVLDDVNALWAEVFRDAGDGYQPTTLVLFTRAHAVRLRPRELGHRAVLLPSRPEGLPRPRFLRRASSTGSAHPATSPRPTSSPTRSGTTSSSRRGSRRRSARRSSRTRAARTSCR